MQSYYTKRQVIPLSKSYKEVRKTGLSAQIMSGIYMIIPLIILYSVFNFIGHYDGRFFDMIAKLSEYAFFLIVPVMSAYIAMAIFGRHVFIPAALVGAISDYYGMGFIGGIASGLLVGYLAFYLEYFISAKHRYLRMSITVSHIIAAIMSTIISGLVVYFLLAPPVEYGLNALTEFLFNLQNGNIIILVMILAAMTSFDLGGPVNKVSFSFVLAAYTNGLFYITGPALIAVTIPPLSMGLLVLIYAKRFDEKERKMGRTSLLLSLVGITEGALPFAIKEPLRVIPSLVIASMVGSGMAAYFKLSNELMLPSIAGLVGTSNILIYLLCHIVGVAVAIVIYSILTIKGYKRMQEETK